MQERSEDKNPLFDLLAGDNNDIEGLAAYALYKRHKRSWAKSIRELRQREPSAEEDSAFARSCATPDQLDRYKKDAQDILLAFASTYVEENRPKIEKDAITLRIEQAADSIESSGGFLSLLKVGVASTIITSALLALLAFGTQYFGIDLVDAIRLPSEQE
jgi:hypothetical protein